MSAGFPGLRVGTGPRGNYVHMGKGGIYYRAAIQNAPAPAPAPTLRPSPSRNDEMVEIESASVLEIVDASSAALVNELNTKLSRTRWWPAVAILAGIGVAMIPAQELLLRWALAIAGVAATFLIYQRDVVNTTTALLYDLEPAVVESFQAFHDAFDDLARCGRVGHIGAQGGVKDRKRSAGAGSVVRRRVIRPDKRSPLRVSTNIEVPAIPVGRQTLHFFPDRLLVIEGRQAGAVPYRDLTLKMTETRFIESEGVPSDAKTVGRTWQYVNKNGGPDRRFKQNRELPIALYEEIHFASSTGLSEVIQASRLGTGAKLERALHRLGREAATDDGG